MLRLLRRLPPSLCCKQPDNSTESDVVNLESVSVNDTEAARPDPPLLSTAQRPVGCVAPLPRKLGIPARRHEDLLDSLTQAQAEMARADTLTAALFSPWPGMEGQGGRG